MHAKVNVGGGMLHMPYQAKEFVGRPTHLCGAFYKEGMRDQRPDAAPAVLLLRISETPFSGPV